MAQSRRSVVRCGGMHLHCLSVHQLPSTNPSPKSPSFLLHLSSPPPSLVDPGRTRAHDSFLILSIFPFRHGTSPPSEIPEIPIFFVSFFPPIPLHALPVPTQPDVSPSVPHLAPIASPAATIHHGCLFLHIPPPTPSAPPRPHDHDLSGRLDLIYPPGPRRTRRPFRLRLRLRAHHATN